MIIESNPSLGQDNFYFQSVINNINNQIINLDTNVELFESNVNNKFNDVNNSIDDFKDDLNHSINTLELNANNINSVDFASTNLAKLNSIEANFIKVNQGFFCEQPQAGMVYIGAHIQDSHSINEHIELANIENTKFDNLYGNNFNINNAVINNVKLTNVEFGELNLNGININDTKFNNLSGYYFKADRVNLTNANLDKVNLTNVNIDNLTNVNIDRANLTNANIDNVNLTNVNIISDLENVNINKAKVNDFTIPSLIMQEQKESSYSLGYDPDTGKILPILVSEVAPYDNSLVESVMLLMSLYPSVRIAEHLTDLGINIRNVKRVDDLADNASWQFEAEDNQIIVYNAINTPVLKGVELKNDKFINISNMFANLSNVNYCKPMSFPGVQDASNMFYNFGNNNYKPDFEFGSLTNISHMNYLFNTYTWPENAINASLAGKVVSGSYINIRRANDISNLFHDSNNYFDANIYSDKFNAYGAFENSGIGALQFNENNLINGYYFCSSSNVYPYPEGQEPGEWNIIADGSIPNFSRQSYFSGCRNLQVNNINIWCENLEQPNASASVSVIDSIFSQCYNLNANVNITFNQGFNNVVGLMSGHVNLESLSVKSVKPYEFTPDNGAVFGIVYRDINVNGKVKVDGDLTVIDQGSIYHDDIEINGNNSAGLMLVSFADNCNINVNYDNLQLLGMITLEGKFDNVNFDLRINKGIAYFNGLFGNYIDPSNCKVNNCDVKLNFGQDVVFNFDQTVDVLQSTFDNTTIHIPAFRPLDVSDPLYNILSSGANFGQLTIVNDL